QTVKKSKTTIHRSATQLTRRDIAGLVRTACGFQCTIMIQSGEFQVNAKSLLGMIALQMKPGMKLCITAEGPDEEQALSAICAWFS
ncbi:MAG: HPr family phosphocarrier protein, partial [Butyricicoccus sp.]